MTYHVVPPPKDEKLLAEVGKELVQAAFNLGANIQPEGFLFAWVGGTRAIVERDPAGKIITLAMMQVGKRWVENDLTGTVLILEGANQDAMVEFLKSICAAMGASHMFVQNKLYTQKAKHREYTVIGHEIG
jgi:hypothetical protein